MLSRKIDIVAEKGKAVKWGSWAPPWNRRGQRRQDRPARMWTKDAADNRRRGGEGVAGDGRRRRKQLGEREEAAAKR